MYTIMTFSEYSKAFWLSNANNLAGDKITRWLIQPQNGMPMGVVAFDPKLGQRPALYMKIQ